LKAPKYEVSKVKESKTLIELMGFSAGILEDARTSYFERSLKEMAKRGEKDGMRKDKMIGNAQ
jgi:hypothetical protein